ncbi:carboxymuconolactone decarboxylase family protein [Cryptosporangium sp. NPDC048952]|uniref:carboxymuconolactone decarboxylase family protein n=1 Tax=Cryptosporangium sp. NPDC048952 TaxID=3363961 RepID=UPI0037202454
MSVPDPAPPGALFPRQGVVPAPRAGAVSASGAGTAPRLAPVARAEWAPDLAEYVAGFRASVGAGRSEEGRASGGNLLGTLAHHPALTKAFLAFNGHLLYGTTLTPRRRELLVLRVAHVGRSDYEWAQHHLLGRVAGLTDEEIARVAQGPDAWTSLDRTLIEATDELMTEGALSDGIWKALAEELTEQQILDVIFTVGAYSTIAMVLRTCGVEAEPELRPYLPRP